MTGRANLLAEVNCRDLDTLEVRPERHVTLAVDLPGDVVAVAEKRSGCRQTWSASPPVVIARSRWICSDESRRSGPPGGEMVDRPAHGDRAVVALRETVRDRYRGRPRDAVEAGADAIGFVLTPSPRQVPLSVAAGLQARLPESILR